MRVPTPPYAWRAGQPAQTHSWSDGSIGFARVVAVSAGRVSLDDGRTFDATTGDIEAGRLDCDCIRPFPEVEDASDLMEEASRGALVAPPREPFADWTLHAASKACPRPWEGTFPFAVVAAGIVRSAEGSGWLAPVEGMEGAMASVRALGRFAGGGVSLHLAGGADEDRRKGRT